MPLPCHYCLKWSNSNLRCNNCKSVYYCTRDCQTKDWKYGSEKYGVVFPKHKSVCKPLDSDYLDFCTFYNHTRLLGHRPVGPAKFCGEVQPEFLDLLFSLQEKSAKRAVAYNHPESGCFFDERAEIDAAWRMPLIYNLEIRDCFYKDLREAVSLKKLPKDMKIGEVITDGTEQKKQRNEKDDELFYRNRPAKKLNLYPGKTYVAIEFVDLTQLLISNYVETSSNEPVNYICIGKDPKKILRSKMIYEMMKDPRCENIAILQMMYSMRIEMSSYKWYVYFNDAGPQATLQEFYQQGGSFFNMMNQVCGGTLEEMSLLNLIKDPDQRKQLATYFFQGELFVNRENGTVGNPTLSSEQESLQSFFRMLDFSWLEGPNDGHLFCNLGKNLMEKMTSLRKLIGSGRIKCVFKRKNVGKPLSQNVQYLKSLNPSVIDWSNLPDEIGIQNFLQAIERVGTSKTVHLIYTSEWRRLIRGYMYSFLLRIAEHEDQVKTFDTARRQLRQDWKRLLEEKPYLKHIFRTNGIPFYSIPITDIIWANYLKFYFIAHFDDKAKEEGGVRFVKLGNNDLWHLPGNFHSWAFDAALVSGKIDEKKRKDLVKKYVEL